MLISIKINNHFRTSLITGHTLNPTFSDIYIRIIIEQRTFKINTIQDDEIKAQILAKINRYRYTRRL